MTTFQSQAEVALRAALRAWKKSALKTSLGFDMELSDEIDRLRAVPEMPQRQAEVLRMIADDYDESCGCAGKEKATIFATLLRNRAARLSAVPEGAGGGPNDIVLVRYTGKHETVEYWRASGEGTTPDINKAYRYVRGEVERDVKACTSNEESKVEIIPAPAAAEVAQAAERGNKWGGIGEHNPHKPTSSAQGAELLPCPFCGPGQSQVDLWHDDVAKRWRVGCGRCGCSTGTSPRDTTQAPAVAAWNRRTPVSPTVASGNGGGWFSFEVHPDYRERIKPDAPLTCGWLPDGTYISGQRVSPTVASDTHPGECTSCGESISDDEVQLWIPNLGQWRHMGCATATQRIEAKDPPELAKRWENLKRGQGQFAGSYEYSKALEGHGDRMAAALTEAQAEITRLTVELDAAHKLYLAEGQRATEAQGRIEKLERKLPDDMTECFIRFRECEHGHGRLVADNWIDNGCQTCRVQAAESTLAKTKAKLGRAEADFKWILRAPNLTVARGYAAQFLLALSAAKPEEK